MNYHNIIKKIGLNVIILLLSGCFVTTLSARQQDTISTPTKAEIIPLGFSSQKRSEISGSVANVTGAELERSPVANLTQSFAGRFPGLFTKETNSTLSKSSTLLSIRGTFRNSASSPIIVIDGIVYNYMSDEILRNFLLPEEIESVTILKDASTQAIYGSQGANGVIVIVTKRGYNGKLRIKTSFQQSFQEVTTKPVFISSGEYAQLRNEAAYNDGRGQFALFSEEAITRYHSGDSPFLYPNNNWYDRYFKDYALMQRANVNLSGGGEHVTYFTNVGIMHQGGQFNTEQEKYNTNYSDLRLNFRSNINARLHKNVETHLFMNGSIIRNRLPGNNSVGDVYRNMFYFPPTMYGPVTPEIIYQETGEVISEGGQVVASDITHNSVYGMLNRSGFAQNTHVNISSQFGIDFDLGFLTRGLKAAGTVAYQTFSYNNLASLQNYERWVRTNNESELDFQKIGTYENTALSYSKFAREYKSITYKGMLTYSNTIGEHRVGGLFYSSLQNLEREDRESPWNIPVNRVDFGLEGTYDFSGKYFVKLNAGYSGVDFYARENRWLLTPAASAAWIISEEPILKESNWLTNLKLRASYGKTGNQQVSTRYSYLDDIEFVRGGPIGQFQYIMREKSYGNPDLKPEISTKQNWAIDLELAKAFTVTVDLFKERMENMVIGGTASIPAYQGVPLDSYPLVNQGAFENKGFDIEAGYRKSFRSGLFLSVGGFLSYAHNEVIDVKETPFADDYAYPYRRTGYPYGQEFGYLVDYSNDGNGFFNTPEEINLTYDFGTPRVGDLKYRDLNNDGIINEKDMVPIGTGSLPKYYYGFTGEVHYRNFDLNFLFQGVEGWSSIFNGIGVYETSREGVFGSLHRNAWSRERYESGAEITYPALSLDRSTNHVASDFYHYNLNYLRLKNIEVGYTLSKQVSKLIAAEKIRVFLSGQNLLTWDNMKSSDFGPESSSYESIPVYRVYNIGLNVSF